MAVSEPHDGNMIDFDERFVGECGFFELSFTGCWCCENCQQKMADKELGLDKDYNDACLFIIFGNYIHSVSTVLTFLFIKCTFLLYMESSKTHNIGPTVPDKFTESRNKSWLLIVATAVLCPPVTTTAAVVWPSFTVPTVCFTYCMTDAVFCDHPPTYRLQAFRGLNY